MSKTSTVYSVCGMCSARCPIAVDMRDGAPRWISGNPHSALKGALCARGAAGIALEEDSERPQQPLIRTGARGEGQWRAVSWDEALDHVAERLRQCAQKHGPQNLLWSDRDGPFTDLYRAFMRGMGSPNVCTHSSTCDLNAHHAGKAVAGYGRGMLAMDYANCKHLVLQGRNIFEALNVAECVPVMAALKNGCRLSVLDVRPTVTGSKAHDAFILRPGSDYAFNLGIIHVLLHEGSTYQDSVEETLARYGVHVHEDGLFQKDYVHAHCTGLDALRVFTRPCTPEWAAAQTGVSAHALRELAHRLAEAAPHVIWHPGWMTSRYFQSFQVSRTAMVINALLGSIGAKGGIVPGSTAKDVGRQGLRPFTSLYAAPNVPRADGVGTERKAFDPGKGLLHRAFEAMGSGKPYPVRSYIAWRHDPLQSMPDPDAARRLLDNLELLVSVTFSWSDTAWYSDVILPLSPYLSRESIIAAKSGLKPQFFVRRRCMEPRYDTRADWEIIGGLARRLGLDALDFSSAAALWDWQLEGTGVRVEDFDATGFVPLSDAPRYPDMSTLKFPTPSGKIELTSAGWEAASGQPMLPHYAPPPAPPEGAFRIVFGRIAVHTQGHTMNNPLLHEQLPVNVACIHPVRAAELSLADGDAVDVLDARGCSAGRVAVRITEGMHPEAVFLLHGFGHRLPCESRARGQGAADQELLPGGLELEDSGGGGLAMQEHFVTLRPVGRAKEASA